MTADLIAAWLHFIGAFALAGALLAQLIVLSIGVEQVGPARLTRIDLFYFAGAILVVAGGVMRVVWGVRGVDYYLQNGFFHLKIGVFVLVGLLSIAPTISFLKWRKAALADPNWLPASAEVKRTRMLVHIELALLVVVILAASLMARAYAL